MNTKLRLRAIALAATCALAGTAAQSAIVLNFSTANTTIAVNDTATVEVSISGLDAQILSAFDITFLWNAAVLGNTGADFTPACDALGGVDALCFDNPGAGSLGLQYFSLLDDAELMGTQPDSFVLGTLTFTGLADGASTITLGTDPFFQRNFVGLRAESLAVEVGSLCIAVGNGTCDLTVPEPASYALVMVALAGAVLPGVRRRRSAAR